MNFYNMVKFNISYDNLIEAHNSKEAQYDKAYSELILPIKDSWQELDSIIDFVRRWNKRVPIGKNKNQIKAAILSLKKEFEVFKNCRIENLKFTPKNITLIKKIYDTLSKTVLKSTGTTKLMHGMNPDLFVMWDKGIYDYYGCYHNSTGYIRFMESMQEIIVKILKQHNNRDIIKETNRTLPKLVDEYNWMHFRTSKIHTLYSTTRFKN